MITEVLKLTDNIQKLEYAIKLLNRNRLYNAMHELEKEYFKKITELKTLEPIQPKH